MKTALILFMIFSSQAYAQLDGEYFKSKDIILGHLKDMKSCKEQNGRFIGKRCYVRTFDSVLVDQDKVEMSLIGQNSRQCEFSGTVSYRSQITENVLFAKQSFVDYFGDEKFCEILLTKSKNNGLDVRVITQDTCQTVCMTLNMNIQNLRRK